VEENTRVVSISKPDRYFSVSADNNGDLKQFRSAKLVVASGCMNETSIPPFAKNISGDIVQVHAGEYRNSWQLPDGAVLVAGSGQSGVQIAEDLMESGRDVYFSTSKVPRVPRRYRGEDITAWMIKTNFFDLKTDEVTDPMIFNLRQPQISGVGKHGHTMSLQYLAMHGVKILGKLHNADNTKVYFHPDAAANVKYADEFSAKFKQMVDGYITQNNLTAPDAEDDFADRPDVNAKCASDITSLDLAENNISSIVWTTGFNTDYSWMKLPVFNGDSKPKQSGGVGAIDGLYFMGLTWMRKRKSAIIYGINEDAEYISGRVQ
jgi:putative flavoprotein involved in K+ transport